MKVISTEGSAILRGFLRLFCLRSPRKIADPSVGQQMTKCVKNSPKDQGFQKDTRQKTQFAQLCITVSNFEECSDFLQIIKMKKEAMLLKHLIYFLLPR